MITLCPDEIHTQKTYYNKERKENYYVVHMQEPILSVCSIDSSFKRT